MPLLSHPYTSVAAAFLTVVVLLMVVGTSWSTSAMWGAVAAIFMLVGSARTRPLDEL